MKKILPFFLVVLVFSSCSNIIIPYYTTVDKMTKVNPGMTKEKVVATLGIEPYEIFHGIEDGCEIHQFKYKHKEVSHGTLNSYANIKGAERFVDPSNVYVYYRDGQVESLVTDDGKKGGPGVISFANELVDACNGPEPIYGCMDKEALNYNKEATHQRDGSIVEDGSIMRMGDCEYCACDYIPNRRYDAKKNCGEKCIPLNPADEEEEEIATIINNPECTLCDLAEKENAQINVNLDFDNEEPEYNGYISKLFGNNVKLSKKKKSKKRRSGNNLSNSKGFDIGLGLRNLSAFFISTTFTKNCSSKFTSATSFSYFLSKSDKSFENYDDEEYTHMDDKMLLSQACLYNFNFTRKISLGLGLSSGVGIVVDEDKDAYFEVYPLSFVAHQRFGRFGIREEIAILKMQNINKGLSFGLTYNF